MTFESRILVLPEGGQVIHPEDSLTVHFEIDLRDLDEPVEIVAVEYRFLTRQDLEAAK